MPPLQVFLTENLEKNEVRWRGKSRHLTYIILNISCPQTKHRVFVRKLGRTARYVCGVKPRLCSPQRKPTTPVTSRACLSSSRRFRIGRRRRKTASGVCLLSGVKNGSGRQAARASGFSAEPVLRYCLSCVTERGITWR